MHAQHEYAGTRIVGTNAADEIQAAEALSVYRQVDDNDIGLVAPVETVTSDEIARVSTGPIPASSSTRRHPCNTMG